MASKIRVNHYSTAYLIYDDVIKWKYFPRYWPFVRGIHRSPVNSPHKGQWRGALMLSLIFSWINRWVNNREAGDLRSHRALYDVIVMPWLFHLWSIYVIIHPRPNLIDGFALPSGHIWRYKCWEHIDGLVQDCYNDNCIANALEWLQSCTKPSLYAIIPWSHVCVCFYLVTIITNHFGLGKWLDEY